MRGRRTPRVGAGGVAGMENKCPFVPMNSGQTPRPGCRCLQQAVLLVRLDASAPAGRHLKRGMPPQAARCPVNASQTHQPASPLIPPPPAAPRQRPSPQTFPGTPETKPPLPPAHPCCSSSERRSSYRSTSWRQITSGPRQANSPRMARRRWRHDRTQGGTSGYSRWRC
jgi:hypothetical protein